MDFTSITFWFCLIPPILIAWLAGFFLKENPAATLLLRKLLILITSLTLLGLTSWETLIIFLLVMMTTYGLCRLGLHLQRRGRNALLALSIPLILSPLLYYKYAYFIGDQILGQEWDTLRDIIIPVGISFYSFQLVGFSIDTLRRGIPMPKLLDYMNFGAFFPQIVAGPIERRDHLLPQMEKLDKTANYADNINIGLRFIILGLFYKMVLADNIATGVRPEYSGESAYQLMMYNLFFTFRIYFDFCGYGLTAYGIARCLGIRLTMNFLSPLSASNISDYWRRWHVSLTTWFRDYIYFPLGGSRTKRWALNLIIVFAISGLWHGANWNFILWGGSLGLGLVVHRLFSKAGLRLWAPLAFFITTLYAINTWMFFYVTDLGQNLHNLEILFTPASYAWEMLTVPYQNIGYLYSILTATVTCGFAIIAIMCEFLSNKKYGDPYTILTSNGCCAIMVYLLFMLTPGVTNQFIYFAF